MELRLGELLIESGVLDERQVQHILSRQQHTGEPFGLLAERLFSVDPAIIEAAWAQQYAALTRTVDPDVEAYDPEALRLVTRRQAWQFRVLPIRFEPGELMIATTQMHLRRALRFATNVIGIPVFFVMAEPEALGRALCRHYPLPGMKPHSVLDDGMARLLGRDANRAA
ncbi:MAG: hypothetical protein SYC29_01145 [Planctomycetota bacterium]|nr:hypothetical protein [Planctomycetota bacterium]